MMAIAAAGRSNMALPVMMQYDPETQRTSLLFEDGNKETVTDRPQVFLDHLCIQYGSTRKGREDAYRALTGFHCKAPVLLSERLNTIYFPTTSPSNPDCVWLDASRLISVHTKNQISSLVLFSSGLKIEVGVDVRVIRNQVKRCEIFLSSLYQKR